MQYLSKISQLIGSPCFRNAFIKWLSFDTSDFQTKRGSKGRVPRILLTWYILIIYRRNIYIRKRPHMELTDKFQRKGKTNTHLFCTHVQHCLGMFCYRHRHYLVHLHPVDMCTYMYVYYIIEYIRVDSAQASKPPLHVGRGQSPRIRRLLRIFESPNRTK